MGLTRRAALLTLAAPALAHAAVPPGPSRLDMPEPTAATGILPLWLHRPAAWAPGGRVLAVLHGADRNAARYREVWTPLAEAAGALLVCPDFTRASYPGAAYNEGRAQPPVFLALTRAMAAARAAAGDIGDRPFDAYGHSAGAQFLHRFLLVCGAPGAGRMVAANAGFYTMPSLDIAWPYGLGGQGSEAVLRDALTRPFTVLLGERDTDPNHPQLRRTPEAMAQGPHRFARGLAFFAMAQKTGNNLGLRVAWNMAMVRGVAHSNAGMAPIAARILWP